MSSCKKVANIIVQSFQIADKVIQCVSNHVTRLAGKMVGCRCTKVRHLLSMIE